MQNTLLLGCVFLALFSVASAYGECTDRDKEKLRKTGMSQYKIDQICGEVQGRPVVKEEEVETVQPKRPNTHGRLKESTNICQTELLWCTLDQEGPPGTPCLCQSPYGPQRGVLVPR
ncbi:MAG: hypothetical protein V2B20_07115 [Pseudomonadota bacterium]